MTRRRGFASVAALAGALGALLGLGSFLFGAAPAAGPVPSPVVPPDVPARAQRDAIDAHSWALFAALNWPATADGKPSGRKIAALPGAPRVWETFEDPIEIFSQGPLARDYPEVHDLLKRRAGAKVFYLTAAGKEILTADFNGTSKELAGTDFTQAGSSWPLIDQLGNYAIYEIRVSPKMAAYITGNGLTTAEALLKFGDLDFPDGSVVVKAAWRIFPRSWLTGKKATLDRYYWRTADIVVDASQDPQGKGFTIEQAPVGLVGLHVVRKTPSQPQWIWSTFEQVDNYEIADGTPGLTPTYNNGKTQVDAVANNRQPLLPSGSPPTGGYLWTRPADMTTAEYTPLAPYTPPQIVRSSNEIPLPAAVNKAWQAALPAPWKHYRLMVTQWTEGGKPGGRPLPRNRDDVSIARNTALESYLLGDQTVASQVPAVRVRDPGDPTRPPQSSLDDMIQATLKAAKYPPADETGPLTWSSCMLCHEVAQLDSGGKVVLTDFSMLFRAYVKQPRNPD